MTQPAVSPPASTIRAGEPIWADLITATPSQTCDFYAALFGWDYQISEEMGGYATAHFNGKKAAGISPPPPQGLAGPHLWQIYFASDDLAADAKRVSDLGGQVVMEPMQIGTQGSMGLFTDASGAMFGLWQDDQHGGFLEQGLPVSVVWCEVSTHDSAQALTFYGELLSATSDKLPEVDYHILQHPARQHPSSQHRSAAFAGVSGMGMAQNWEAVGAGGWMVYFYTPNPDQTGQTAEQYGGKVLVQPFDTPNGRIAVLADPAGTVFSVVCPIPPATQ